MSSSRAPPQRRRGSAGQPAHVSSSCASNVSFISSTISSSVAGRSAAGAGVLLLLAEREREREPAARHLVERVGSSSTFFGSSARLEVELRGRRELERQRVARERGRVRLGEHRRGRDRRAPRPPAAPCAATPPGAARARATAARASAAGGAASRLGLRCLPARSARGRQTAPAAARPGRAAAAPWPCSSRSRRKASDSRERSEPGRVTFTSAELERQARVAALAHVVDRDVQQVDQPDHGRLAELVRLLAQPLACLLGHGQRVGHLAHVLDEHQVAQVLEQVGDEPPEVLALLGELLQEDERAGGVAVDDEVAEPEERLLLDRAEQLEHVLHGDRAARSRRRAGRASRPASRKAPRRRAGDRARAPCRARRSPRRRRRGAAGARGRAGAAAGRRTSGSASARSAAPSAARSCRRRRRGAAAAPRSASGARSRRRR